MVLEGECRISVDEFKLKASETDEVEGGYAATVPAHFQRLTTEKNIEKTTFKGKANTLFILPAQTPHNQQNFGMVRTIYAVFDGAGHFDDSPKIVKLEPNSWIEKWLKDIHALAFASHFDAPDLCSCLLSAVLRRIAEMETKERRHHSYPAPLVESLRYMDREFTSPISLDDVAKIAGVSAGHLCNLFKTHLSNTPVKYLLAMRLRHSRRLLRDSYLSVKEISHLCGFNDVNYFCRRFKERFQQTPGDYRRQL